MSEKVWIPEVPEERIRELAERIKPVINGRYIKPVDLFKVAYTWDPKLAKRAVNLEPVRDITTYHTFGYYGFFKPSIAEVLAQIPADLLEKVVAFEIIGSPTTADDLNRESVALNAGYHVAVTRLYIAKQQSAKSAKKALCASAK